MRGIAGGKQFLCLPWHGSSATICVRIRKLVISYVHEHATVSFYCNPVHYHEMGWVPSSWLV